MRYIKAIILAALVTGALFIGMQVLVKGGDDQLSEAPRGRVLDFVRVKKDEVVEQKQDAPKKPPKPEEPPPELEPPKMDSADLTPNESSTSFSTDVQADAGLDGSMSLDSGDGEYLPIVKVAAIYPRRALSRGIEGFVLLEFTVTELGTVVDPVVIDAEPKGVFNQSALAAVKKYKYKPRVVDGNPVRVPGVQNQITYKMKQ